MVSAEQSDPPVGLGFRLGLGLGLGLRLGLGFSLDMFSAEQSNPVVNVSGSVSSDSGNCTGSGRPYSYCFV